MTIRGDLSSKQISPLASRKHLAQEAMDPVPPTQGDLELIEMYARGIVPRERPPPRREKAGGESEETQLKRVDLAKWKAVEIFKGLRSTILSSVRFLDCADHHQLPTSGCSGHFAERELDRCFDRDV